MLKAEILQNNVIVIEDNIVSDSVKFETVSFKFPDSWDGYIKTAVFVGSNGESFNVLLNADNNLCISENECYIPHEVICGKGFEISVFGVKGDSVATATKAFIKVLESGYVEGEAPSEPTPTEYSQIINLTAEAVGIAQSVRSDADNGLFRGEKGDKGERGEKGDKGDNGEKGDTGTQGPQGVRGYSGLVPSIGVAYAANVVVLANLEMQIGELVGDITITLSTKKVEGYSNEWIFVITQGETAYDVVLPVIEWQLGIAPTFSANTTTEVRLYYIGDTLKGVWN